MWKIAHISNVFLKSSKVMSFLNVCLNDFSFLSILLFTAIFSSTIDKDNTNSSSIHQTVFDVLLSDKLASTGQYIWILWSQHMSCHNFDHKTEHQIHPQPLEVDLAYFSCIGNQWQANYLWKIHTVLNYCCWKLLGFIQEPDRTNHPKLAPSKWQVTHLEAS